MTRLNRRYVLPALLTAFAVGCGGSDTGMVNGTVTLDGQPLKTGDVRFVPADGKSQTASAEVRDGKFSASVPAGEMRVEISAPKALGKRKMYDTPDAPEIEEVGELLPARYNAKSELKITVKGGTQSEAFDLKSK